MFPHGNRNGPAAKCENSGVACHDEPRAVAREAGRRDEARAMLAEIYGWFTEGFDTADLKEAKALARWVERRRRRMLDHDVAVMATL